MHVNDVLVHVTNFTWKYTFGKEDLGNKEADCSGFAWLFMHLCGDTHPRMSTAEYYALGTESRASSYPQIVVVRDEKRLVGHCGVLLNPSLVVDVSTRASSRGSALATSSIYKWLRFYEAIYPSKPRYFDSVHL